MTFTTGIKAHLLGDASVGIASNIHFCLCTSTCISSICTTAASHYILGYHNVKVCSCRQAESQATTGNSAVRDLFVESEHSKHSKLGGYQLRVVSSSSTPDSSTPDSSTIYALQLLIASHKQFRGFWGQSPQF